jgi:3-hydroxyisobutyrate dehydrogenase-like beta-hydroxyacid dehydrogenase
MADGPVGVVGAGAMGLPIVGHLARAGFDVVCCDTDAARRGAVEHAGARFTTDVAGLADASVVLLLVPSNDDVVATTDALVQCLRDGSVLVICSSVTPQTCTTVGARAATAGLRVVDAALTGGIRGAEAGHLHLLVGGDATDVRELEKVFAAFASDVHHLGRLGSGQVAKTVNNLIHWGEIVTVVEALSLGARLGVPVETLRGALAGGSSDSRTLRELQLMRFTWFEKDLDDARAMASSVGADLPVGEFAQELMRRITVDGVAALLGDDVPLDLAAPRPV